MVSFTMLHVTSIAFVFNSLSVMSLSLILEWEKGFSILKSFGATKHHF
jgi:hypothetical protein